jgi:hypothetical protein
MHNLLKILFLVLYHKFNEKKCLVTLDKTIHIYKHILSELKSTKDKNIFNV